MTLKPFIVGIDPGVATGLALWIREQNQWSWSEHDFFTVQTFLASVFENKADVKIYLEHPFGGHVQSKRAKSLDGGSQDKYIGNTGGNRREAELLAESLRRSGWDVELVSPVREAKWTAEKFRLFTGSRNPASQHCRDAVRLADFYRKKRELKN